MTFTQHQFQTEVTLPYKINKIKGRPGVTDIQALNTKVREILLHYNQKFPHGLLQYWDEAASFQAITGEAAAPPELKLPDEAAYITSVEAQTSAVAVQKLELKYNKELKEYLEHQAITKAVFTAIVNAIEPQYLSTLKNGTLGFHGKTLKHLAKHLNETYGKIEAADITANETRIKQPWHPQLSSMESFWTQHEDGKAYTAQLTKGKIDDDRLIIYATENLRNTNITSFKDELTKFEKLPDNEQTWNTFKDMITTAYNNLPTIDKTVDTTKTLGYNGSANAATEQNSQDTPHYCWSHGVTWNKQHTSNNCMSKFPGHVDKATFYNLCGGCTRIYRRNGDVAVWKPRPRPNNENNPRNSNRNNNNNNVNNAPVEI